MAKQCMSLTYLDLLWILLLPLMFMQAGIVFKRLLNFQSNKFSHWVGNPIPQPWSGASSLNSSPSSGNKLPIPIKLAKFWFNFKHTLDVQVALIERQKFSPLLIPVLVETVRKYGTEVGIPVFKKIAEGKRTFFCCNL